MSKAAKPPFRRLRIYAFDPSASTDLQTAVVNEAVIRLDWEDLTSGPIGEYLEVVDYDPASRGFYVGVDLNEKVLLVQDGFPPSEGNPKFHQQMVYAVAMMTIANFERALGRKIIWAPHFEGGKRDRSGIQYVERLRIYPHALREANAYYSPRKKALLFGYFRASRVQPGRNLPGGMVFTCLSHDIVAHETAHAILDGMHRRYLESSNPDVLAFHEAFADIVALFQHFTLPEAVRQQISQLRGDLGQRSLLSNMARQFGEAIGNYGALREAIDDVDATTGLPDPNRMQSTFEPHERGAILVAAVFDTFVSIYRSRVADLIRLTTGDASRFPDRDLHPDLVNRLTVEATKAAGHVLRMCVRALDYLPPVDITFGDFLRAIITADTDLVANDDRNYRIAAVEAFRRRGIYPRDSRSLAVDSLLWEELQTPIDIDWLKNERFEYRSTRQEIWDEELRRRDGLKTWFAANAEHNTIRELGLWLSESAPKTIRRSRQTKKPIFEVHSVRSTRRIGPDGEQTPLIIIEITQERRGFRHREEQEEAERTGRASGAKAAFTFRGGCTLVADLYSRTVRYCIRKDIGSNERLEEQRQFLFERPNESLAATYFGLSQRSEPFAFIHRSPEGAP